VLSIDDASRTGHTVLALFAIAAMILAVVLTGTPVLSLRALLLAPAGGVIGLIAGRRLGLRRQDRRLRERVIRYCREARVSERELAEAARSLGRYEFFTKLIFGPPPRTAAESMVLEQCRR